jgi:putative peptide maturation dehydrogenase
MSLYRRSQYLLVTMESLGATDPTTSSVLVLTSILSGQHLLATASELDLLRRVPATDWVGGEILDDAGLALDRIEVFVGLGVLLERDLAVSALFLEKEERLLAGHWPPCAAAFHLLNHFHESRLAPWGTFQDFSIREKNAELRAAAFVAEHGLPPPTFQERQDSLETIDLPLDLCDTAISQVLLRRRTVRHFEKEKFLPLAKMSHLLRLTLGAWAMRTLPGPTELLLKTSPSGGSLHPIEGFPLILRAEGQKSGLYHYRVKDHRLELLHQLTEDRGRRLAVYFAQGQGFAGTCALLIVLVARFNRNFWKYQERENSYAVVLQDAGHLSQTFQIVATDLGLGSFYTAAINSDALVEFLGLSYPDEAPLGILGVGFADTTASSIIPIESFSPQR